MEMYKKELYNDVVEMQKAAIEAAKSQAFQPGEG